MSATSRAARRASEISNVARRCWRRAAVSASFWLVLLASCSAGRLVFRRLGCAAVGGVDQETSGGGLGALRGFRGMLGALFGGFEHVEHAVERVRGAAEFGVGAVWM